MVGARPGGSHDPPLLPQTALQLEPLHFLQCHSKNNSPRDLETQLWACAFEPAWDEGTSSGGRRGEGHREQAGQAFWARGLGIPRAGAAWVDGGIGRDRELSVLRVRTGGCSGSPG